MPAANFNGNASFTYSVTDDLGLADGTPATVTIAVTAVNDAPVANDVAASGAEDGGTITVMLSGTDVDGTVTNVTFTSLPTSAQGRVYIDSALTTLAATGTSYGIGTSRVYFVPAANFNGTVDFGYSVRDNSGATDATPGTVTITVTPVNDAPVAGGATGSGVEDAASIAVTLGGSDIDGTVQGVTLVTLPTTAQGKLYTDATLLVEATLGTYAGGSLTLYFVPAANFNGTATFSYTVVDDLGLSDASPATATLTISAVNDVPVANAVTASGAEDAASISITLGGTDVEGAIAKITLATLPNAADGKLYTDAARTVLAVAGTAYNTGSLTLYFAPAANFNGTVDFTYTVTDAAGAVDATPATASITVTPVNDAPVATGATASGNEDAASIPITLGGSDVDGTVQSVTLSTLPTVAQGKLYTDASLSVEATPGTYVGSSLTLYFVPAANFNGNAGFTYTVTDDLGLADASPATATISVAAVNDVPVATDVSASGAEDAASIAITLTGTDVEGAIAKITLATLPNAADGKLYTDAARTILAVAGTAYNTSSLTLYFAPAANFNGTVDFTYTVTDAPGAVDATPATASITVTPVNDAPVAAGATASGNEDAASIPITLGGSDVDGTVQSVTLSTLPTVAQGKLFTDAALTVEATLGTYAGGSLTLYFVPALNFNGNASFTYTVTDDLGLADASPATATIAVAAVNDAPVAAGASASGAEDAASITITLGGSDVDGTIAGSPPRHAPHREPGASCTRTRRTRSKPWRAPPTPAARSRCISCPPPISTAASASTTRSPTTRTPPARRRRRRRWSSPRSTMRRRPARCRKPASKTRPTSRSPRAAAMSTERSPRSRSVPCPTLPTACCTSTPPIRCWPSRAPPMRAAASRCTSCRWPTSTAPPASPTP
ncbi:tandem-95 repeat protein [Ramlibacter terrae]|uniref:Tandem-95 repeat protein n=1 Tax=Ramlibacter terrae TaxID=2732511 RepID=A0ABX6P590_9BURK|nr:tandem-95 repeat protein [Ramlibacter terrae]